MPENIILSVKPNTEFGLQELFIGQPLAENRIIWIYQVLVGIVTEKQDVVLPKTDIEVMPWFILKPNIEQISVEMVFGEQCFLLIFLQFQNWILTNLKNGILLSEPEFA